MMSMPANGGAARRLGPETGNQDAPSLSRDGSRVAFVSDHEGARDLYVMNIDGSNVTRLTRDLVVYAQAGWSPGDRQIVFSAQATGRNEIYVINADGSGLKRITFGTEGRR